MRIPRTQMVKRISETTDPSNPTKHIEPLRENPNRRKESKNVENEPEGLDSEGRTVDSRNDGLRDSKLVDSLERK